MWWCILVIPDTPEAEIGESKSESGKSPRSYLKNKLNLKD
jgi:hypothetical protein